MMRKGWGRNQHMKCMYEERILYAARHKRRQHHYSHQRIARNVLLYIFALVIFFLFWLLCSSNIFFNLFCFLFFCLLFILFPCLYSVLSFAFSFSQHWFPFTSNVDVLVSKWFVIEHAFKKNFLFFLVVDVYFIVVFGFQYAFVDAAAMDQLMCVFWFFLWVFFLVLFSCSCCALPIVCGIYKWKYNNCSKTHNWKVEEYEEHNAHIKCSICCYWQFSRALQIEVLFNFYLCALFLDDDCDDEDDDDGDDDVAAAAGDDFLANWLPRRFCFF